MDDKTINLLKALPPIVACIVWDVVNENITANTIKLADQVSEDEWQKYDVVRCIAAGNPEHPPIDEAKALVEMMIETIALQPA